MDNNKEILTVGKVIEYNRIIKAIVDNASDVNALVKFRLLGMCKQFEPIVANFEIIREEKIKQYGTTKENGNIGIFMPVKTDFENDEDYDKAMKEFEDTVDKLNAELDEILKSDSELKLIKFKYTDIIDAGLPSDYLLAIYDLIEE